MASCQLGQDNNEQTGAQPLVFHRSYTHLKTRRTSSWLGSCLNQEEDAPIFDAIKSAQPDLFLMVGDNAYADIYRDDVTRMRVAHNDLSELLASQHLPFPIEAVWDDHDYGTNDGGRDWKHKKSAEQIFLDFWQVSSDDERRQRPGIYFQQRLQLDGAEVQIIYLDTRYFRSDLKETDSREPGKERYVPTDDPEATMVQRSGRGSKRSLRRQPTIAYWYRPCSLSPLAMAGKGGRTCQGTPAPVRSAGRIRH